MAAKVELAAKGDFYAVIMAAMKMADTDNSAKLKATWPSVFEELRCRYNAPCGLQPGDCDNKLKVRMTESGELVDTH